MQKRRAPASRGAVPRCAPHGKEAYKTRAAAVNALARYVLRRRGEYKPRRVYRASCGYWHLTSKP